MVLPLIYKTLKSLKDFNEVAAYEQFFIFEVKLRYRGHMHVPSMRVVKEDN